jgi:hypothetical protein
MRDVLTARGSDDLVDDGLVPGKGGFDACKWVSNDYSGKWIILLIYSYLLIFNN